MQFAPNKALFARKGGAGIADRFPFLSRLSTTPLCERREKPVKLIRERRTISLPFLFHFQIYETNTSSFVLLSYTNVNPCFLQFQETKAKKDPPPLVLFVNPFKHLFHKSHLREIKLPFCWRDRS